MLTEEQFLEAIKYLKAYYTNFDFNVNDTMKLTIWHSKFKKYSLQEIQALFKAYTEEVRYAPKSPTDILDFFETKLVNTRESEVHMLFQKVLDDLRYGNYYRWSAGGGSYSFKKYLEDIKDQVPLARTVNALKDDIQRVLIVDNSGMTFVKKDFARIYQSELKNYVKETIRNGGLLLNNGQVALKLEYKKENE